MRSQASATILLLEDDPALAQAEQLHLERAGYQVVTAGTTEEGLGKVSEGSISLIILDQKVGSGTSGLDYFRQVRGRGYDLPAILVTSVSDSNLLIEALRAGVRDFIPKTETFLDQLEPAVKRVLEQARIDRELAESKLIAREQAAKSRELEREISGASKWSTLSALPSTICGSWLRV